MTDDSTKHPATVLAARIWDVLQNPVHSTTEEEIEQILRDGMAELGLAQVGVDLAAEEDRSVRYAWNPRPMTGRERQSAADFYRRHKLGVADPVPPKAPLPALPFPNPCSEMFKLMERQRREIMKAFFVPAEMLEPRDIECQASGFNIVETPGQSRNFHNKLWLSAGIHDGKPCNRNSCSGTMLEQMKGLYCQCSECGAQA